MWRVVVYMFRAVCLLWGILFMQQGMPMTFKSTVQASTLEPGANGDNGRRPGQAADHRHGSGRRDDPDQQVGTNGGGFFGANAAHPFENPSAWTNFLTCLGMMLFPSTLVLMSAGCCAR